MRKPTLWIDITELFSEFTHRAHPTGVSRVVINLVDRLRADPGAVFGAARPLFWYPVHGKAYEADLDEPASTFFERWSARLGEARLLARPRWPQLQRRIEGAVPKPYRYSLFPGGHGVMQYARWTRRRGSKLRQVRFEPTDCLFAPGSFWLGGYIARLAERAGRAGASCAAYVHDVLPISHPEWFGSRHSEQFRRGAEAFLPLCSAIACNSSATAERLRQTIRLPEDLPVRVCRLGDIPQCVPDGPIGEQVRPLLDSRYVLFVSSIMPRKNHDLLVTAWSRLDPDRDDLHLVLVGGGGPTAAMDKALAGAGRDRLSWLRGVSGAELEALYRNAWMTAYPSHDEGYGLPVAESLALGKACMASMRGGIADVAPGLVDAIDPDDPDSVVSVVRHYLDAPGALAAREQQIRNGFRPTSWDSTAADVRALLEGSPGRLPVDSVASIITDADRLD